MNPASKRITTANFKGSGIATRKASNLQHPKTEPDADEYQTNTSKQPKKKARPII